jgi:ankyrin repeat protein
MSMLDEANVRVETPNKQTPLHYACQYNRADLIHMLITKYKNSIEDKDIEDSTPLHIAALNGHLQLLKHMLLIKLEPDSNVSSSTSDFSREQVAECSEFLKNHMPVDNNGDTILHVASKNGHLNIIQFLISEIGYPLNLTNLSGQTCLHQATEGGHFPVVKYLLTQGSNEINLVDGYGWSPAYYAAREGHLEILKYLVERNPAAALLKTTKAWRTEDSTFAAGESLVHAASYGGVLSVVKYLVEDLHLDPSHVGEGGAPPLEIATYGGHLDIVKYLITEQRCDPFQVDKFDNTALSTAVCGGNLDIVKYLIEDVKCDPNSRVQDGSTPFHDASAKGHLEVVQYLIETHHCDPSLPNNYKSMPLHEAAINGKLDTVKYLVEDMKCDPNSRGQNGSTPLQYASRNGHLEVIQYLIDTHHCDPSLRDGVNDTPLHDAALNGKLDTVKYLIEDVKCDPNSRGQDGSTPLHYASRNGHLEVIQYLIDTHHCDPSLRNGVNDTPLHDAAFNGKLDTVKYLIEDAMCDPNNCSDQQLLTPLSYARIEGHLEVIQYLIDHNNKIRLLHEAASSGKLGTVKNFIENRKYNPNGRDPVGATPLYCACKGGHLEVMQYLVDAHHCDDPPLQNDETLHLAVLSGKLDTVKFLIEKEGCDPNCRGKNGATLLHSAAIEGHLEIIQYLVSKHHCDPSLRDDKDNATLHLAAENGKLHIVKYLIENWKCRCDDGGQNGKTPLHFACEKGHLDVVQYLLDVHHCDPMLPDSKRVTPLLLACSHSHSSIVKHILSSGRCDLGSKRIHNWSAVCRSSEVNKYLTHVTDTIPHLAPSVYVVGSCGTGKTTLVSALQKEGGFKLLNKYFSIPTVSLHTVGVISTSFTSSLYGSVKLFDFAGQEEYHANHQLLFNNAIFPVFLVIADFSLPDEQEIVGSINSWLKLLTHSLKPNCTASVAASVVVVGSHLDMISIDKLPLKLKTLQRQVNTLFSSKSYLKYEGIITIDCRKSYSDGMTQLRKILHRVCESIRVQTCDVVTSQISSNLTSVLLNLSSRPALPFTEFSSHAKRVGIIPDKVQSEEELYGMCEILNHCGKLLLLKDQDSYEKSWLILDESLILTQVQKELKELQSESCGLVSLSELKKLDCKDLDLPTFIQYLLYAQICNKVNVESFSVAPSDEYYFFPGLINDEKPNTVESKSKTPLYTWCLEYEEPVTPRFLQTLLIQLTQPLTEAGDISPPKYRVWRKGVFTLSHDTTEVLIEISKSSSQISLNIRSKKGEEIALMKRRSSLIKLLTALSAKHCSTIKSTEYISMQLESNSEVSSPKIPLRDVAAAVINGTATVASNLVTHSITTLSCIEPLQLLSPITLKCFFLCHGDFVPDKVMREFHESIEAWAKREEANAEKFLPLSSRANLTYKEFHDYLKDYSIFLDRNLWVSKLACTLIASELSAM